MTYFASMRGYVTPADDYESNTSASLKDIIATLKAGETNGADISDDTYDAAERLLYKYQVFVLQGIREKIANHKGVSWYLVDKCSSTDNRVLISYQDGPRGEWRHECWTEEVPLWLLLALFRRIRRRKPLGDQEADETVARIDDLDAAYVSAKDKQDLDKNLGGHNLGGTGH